MVTPARVRAPAHAPTPEDDHDRFMLGFLIGLRFQLFNFFTPKKKSTTQKHKKKKLRGNIVLNNKEAPMHDTTNTCPCDCGVRATVQSVARVSGCVYRVMRS